MKTIFITISDGEVSKNILQTDIFRLLKDCARLVLLVNPHAVEYFTQLVGSASVCIEAMPPSRTPWLEDFFSDIFLYSVHTPSIKVKIEHSFGSGGSRVGKYLKQTLWYLGGFRWYRSLWRVAYSLVPDRSFEYLFIRYAPDLIFAANLTSANDARLLRAANRQHLLSMGIPKGWDNLTLKTFLQVFPGLLLVQTPLMKQDAIALDYPEEDIRIVGFPKFDVYSDKGKLLSRKDFMNALGFDPKRKLILYAGAGDQLAPYDEDVLTAFLDAVAAGQVAGSPQILVRPHPKYAYHAERVPPRDFWKLDRPGRTLGGGRDFNFSEEDITHLMNSLYHCNLLIHTASTLGIEAAIFDKPSVTVAYDGGVALPPALSVTRYYKYVHLQRVIATGGMKVATHLNELVRFTNEYLNNPNLDSAARLVIANENAGEVDGKAGERVVAEILTRLKE